MPKIKINDAEFYYELHGKGIPLILISGYNCDHLCWEPVLKELSEHFQVLIFDNRGSGQTTDSGLPLTIGLMADDVNALMDKLNMTKAHIVGQSMGGTIAQVFAIRYPEKINKLGLLTTTAKWRLAMLGGFHSLLLMRELDCNFDLIFKASMPWIAGQSFLQNEQAILQFKNTILDNPYPQSLKDQQRQYKLLEEFDATNQVKNIQAHTMILWGNEDLLTLPDESRYLAEHIPNAELAELACGHLAILEQTQVLTERLIQFLAT